MTKEKLEKAKVLEEQIAKLTADINVSYLPDGFRYIDAEIVYRVKDNNGENIKLEISIPNEIIAATIHEVRDFYIEKKCELEKQFKEL